MPVLFSEIATKYAMPDGVVVDQVIRKAPIIDSATFQPTNYGMKMKYAEVKTVTAMTAVNRNDSYPAVGAERKVDEMDITIYAGTQEVHVDTAKEWGDNGAGAMAYFEEQNPVIVKQTLAEIEKDLIYSPYRGFEVVSKAFGKTVQFATSDTSPNSYYSLYIVGWEQGNMSMLFNPKGYSADGIVKETALSGGTPYMSSGKPVYGKIMEMTMGFFPVNKNNIAGIVNFKLSDVDTNFFKMVNDALALVEGDSLKLYAHPLVISRMMQAEEAQTIVDRGINRRLWGTAEMVGSRNFLQGTEAFVTI